MELLCSWDKGKSIEANQSVSLGPNRFVPLSLSLLSSDVDIDNTEHSKETRKPEPVISHEAVYTLCCLFGGMWAEEDTSNVNLDTSTPAAIRLLLIQ